MEFVKFKRAVHAQFNQLAAGADMLFLTNVDKDALWDCYLESSLLSYAKSIGVYRN